MTLSSPHVEVFRVDLTDPGWVVGRCIAILGNDEREQENRFKYASDRNRYIVSHAALRLILGYRLRSAPQAIVLGKGEFGKPCIIAAPDVHFSLSHSGQLALIAVSKMGPIGVDMEMIAGAPTEVPPLFPLLAPRERMALSELVPTLQQSSFLRCWVRKEAILKATGLGLSRGLKEFAVPIDDQACDAAFAVDLPDHGRWRVLDLPAGVGYVAALATEGIGPNLRPCLRDFAYIGGN